MRSDQVAYTFERGLYVEALAHGDDAFEKFHVFGSASRSSEEKCRMDNAM